MGKAHKDRKTKSTSDGLLRRLFSKPLRERFCKACGRPYVGHVEPIPARRFILGNVEVQVFESKPYGRLRHELKVQCWNRYRDDWYPQSVFTLDDFKHLANVVDHALQFMQESEHPPKDVQLQ